MAMMKNPLIIRSFHRQSSEPNGCLMLIDLPRMSEPSYCQQFSRLADDYSLDIKHGLGLRIFTMCNTHV